MSNREVVLVVDDSDVIRHSLKNFFSDYNLDVVTCLNGLEGIKKALEHKPKLILLDLLMPNFDGVKMLQVIKLLDDLKSIPVIVISGNADKNNVLAALEAGADKVITKPLQKDVMIRSIKEVLGNDFLKKTQENVKPSFESSETRQQLIKFFLHSFRIKKAAIAEAVENRNIELLKTIFHEIKGSGSTVGYEELTRISEEIETRLDYSNVDWKLIKAKCSEVFRIVEGMESSSKIVLS